ncbi:hypothetical protein D3C72_2499170 [compost metagenome]
MPLKPMAAQLAHNNYSRWGRVDVHRVVRTSILFADRAAGHLSKWTSRVSANVCF